MKLLAEMFERAASLAPSRPHYIAEYAVKADGVVSLVALRPDIARALMHWLTQHEQDALLERIEPRRDSQNA